MRFDRRGLLQAVLLAGVVSEVPFRGTGAAPATPAASPVPLPLPNEDGYELWLRYRPVDDPQLLAHYRAAVSRIVQLSSGPIAQAITDELDRVCKGMLDHRPVAAGTVTANGTILIGTPDTSSELRNVIDAAHLSTLGDEGFVLRTTAINGYTTIVIAANHERGLLYGTFALIKQMQLRKRLDSLDIVDAPRANIRVVNHWDNFDRQVERGYAGLSIFDFQDLTAPNPRYEDYARTLASVGINGAIINNVNANPIFLKGAMMPGYVKLADTLRRWGIKLYLSANFASPMDLTARDPHPITAADPLDKAVQEWWAKKAEEIYKAIPDFGGFLVKANSEGQPGPLNYNRTHAEGANMLARALKPHGGIVIWRSFVHKGSQGWSEFEYQSFRPLDGQFDSNVILQTKNGPIDFMVREPVNPLFGAMPRTNQMIELQITQEYTGHATHLCYLPTYWRQVLTFETHYQGTGPTVADVIDGTAYNQPLTGFAGVINFGDDRNWTGSFLAAANTHGFGRLAWDHTLDAHDIATEWVKLTFGTDEKIVSTVVPMLLSSWRTYEKYTAPFGLGYLMRPYGAHFEPDPRGTQNLSHFSDSHGSGYDRTLATGSGYTRLYSDYWFNRYEHLETCPEELMMFMHIVPWDHRLANGNSAIQQIYDDHFAGADEVLAMGRAWKALEGRVDRQRLTAIAQQFDRHLLQSRIWRDVLVSYYFDYARTISAKKSWVQLEIGEYPTVLRGGLENTVPIQLTNATDQSQTLQLAFDRSFAGWTVTSAKETLLPRQTKTVSLSIKPQLHPYLGPVGIFGMPTGLTALGFDTQIMAVMPAPRDCTFAFDVGSSPNKVEPGYAALTSADIWRGDAKFGWIGSAPRKILLANVWDLLQDDCASDVVPRTIRLRIPPGKQRAWVLIGGNGEGTHPIRVMDGHQTLVETGYLADGIFQWSGFTLDGGSHGRTVDLGVAGVGGRQWQLAALVVLMPGL